MSKLLNTKTSVSLCGTSEAKIKSDLCGDIIIKIHKALSLLWTLTIERELILVP